MHNIYGFGINDTVYLLSRLLNEKGIVEKNNRTKSEMLSIYNVTFKIHNPTDLYLDLEGRKSNIFALIAETLWVLSGSIDINPFLSLFLKRAKDFSDDGLTWRGGYGKRLYKNKQLNYIVENLSKDKTSRRAVLSIYDPGLDTPDSLKKVYGLNNTVDLPCNNLLYFYITNDKLCLHVTQRSGDIIWGLGSINLFEWLSLQNIISSILGVEVGYYTHYVNNLHVYKTNKLVFDQFKNIVDKKCLPKTRNNNHNLFKFKKGLNIDNFRVFMNEIYILFCMLIKELENKSSNNVIESIFNLLNNKLKEENILEIDNNEFYCWIFLIVNYILYKFNRNDLLINLSNKLSKSLELKKVVKNCSFIGEECKKSILEEKE